LLSQIATLIFDVVQRERALHPDRPPLIGVAGSQGSGKTTICQLLEATNRPRFAHFSLDDVYLSKSERADLAKRVHPLFATRGPPGTHDIDRAVATCLALRIAAPDQSTRLPRFDKAGDEPVDKRSWPVFRGRPDAILIDGWCLGALPPEPSPPINAIEAVDSDNHWRNAQSAFLRESYWAFFSSFDAIIYLKAPSWEIVRAWRGQQERHMLGRALSPEEDARLDRFVMHYERLTRSMLAGRHTAQVVVHLDEARNVARVEE